MATISSIEWTDATWNPTRGCSVTSPGCRNCYAMKQAHRFSGPGGAYDGLTKSTSRGPVWTGEIRPIESMLDWPRRERTPRRIFVNSMSDLFHEDLPAEFIARVFDVMQDCPQHTFQVLTKRAGRLRDLAPHLPWPTNVWMGVSAEDQRRANERIPLLLQTDAAVKYLSLEPLLGPIDLSLVEGENGDGPDRGMLSWIGQGGGIDWVIVGGESGPRARPMRAQWAESLQRQCERAGVAFFFKQWGGVRKSETGRKLHGRTYDEMPADVRA